jgi:DNA-directed RNA polymerase sigma subunit (sigma70/sigma32)
MLQLKMEREAALKSYLQVVAALPRPAESQRRAWLRAWRGGNADAGRLLLESFLPMVVAEAAARRGLGARFEALLAAGNRALAKALPSVDEEDFEKELQERVVAALKDAWVAAAEKSRLQGHF